MTHTTTAIRAERFITWRFRRPAVRLFMGVAALALAVATLVIATPGAHADAPAPDTTAPGILVPQPLRIMTDRETYVAGDTIQVCYRVPAPGRILITEISRAGEQTLRKGFEENGGDCFKLLATLPFGKHCLQITYWYPFGNATARAFSCFSVAGLR
jgi:hypothetical protein